MYFYSPIIKTHAESSEKETANPQVNVDIGSIIGLSVDTEELVLSATANEFVQGSIIANVYTNSQYGYTLTLEDKDNDTNMVSTTSGVTDVVSSNFSGGKTSSTIADNNWGYSSDSINFYAVPINGNPAILNRRLNKVPTAYESTIVDFGVKVGMSLTSGTYKDTIVFTAYVNGSDGSPSDSITPSVSGTMQDFNCDDAVSGRTVVLRDTRDGNSYTVAKLADGKCWMTENLRIQGRKLTSADSDVDSDYILPASSISGFTDDDYDVSAVYVDSLYGGYYNWYTATAGEGVKSMTSGDTSISICPKGWRLPTGDWYTGDFLTLYASYNNSYEAIMKSPANLVLSGEVRYSALSSQGKNGYYRSSTAVANTTAFTMGVSSSYISPYGNGIRKFAGLSVRCVAR